MSTLRKIDSWGTASITFDGEQCVELVRSALVIGLSGSDALIDATSVSGIPLPWEAFPGRPEMRALTYSVEPISGDAARVDIRYINRDFRKVRGGNAPEIVQRDYDISGTQITMVHQGQTYVGVVNALAPRPVKTIQLIMPQEGYENGVDIDAIQRDYQNVVVANVFFGSPGGFWFCEAIDYETIGEVAYDVTFTFRGRRGYPPTFTNSGWLARTIPEDETGQPIAGATPKYSIIYDSVDFSNLNLEP